MWMQLLGAAGFEVIGEAFPRNWGETIRDANPRGFYESKLVGGVHHGTNPDPSTGAFLFPEQVRSHAVKIFIPGVIRTELAYLDRCIVTVRPWPEYVASLRKLQGLSSLAAGLDDSRRQPFELAPELEWWSEHFALVRDMATRRYPIHFEAYDNLLADPHGVLSRVFEWIGAGDVDAAAAAIDPSLHRNKTSTVEIDRAELPAGCVETFDLLYDTIARSQPLTGTLIDELNETHSRLRPLYLAHKATMTDYLARRISGEIPS